MDNKHNEEEIIIQAINIQGMSHMKKYELEKMIERQERRAITVTGIVETQIKEDRYTWEDGWKVYEERRDISDKRGGGLILLHLDHKYIKMEKIETNHRDILAIRGTIKGKKMMIVLIYMATGNTQTSRERNVKIDENLRKLIDENKEENGIILLGDFNGHLGHNGRQQEDDNGKRIKRMVEEQNLAIANLDERCEGVMTWHRGESESAIDFIILDSKMLEVFQKMIIDENQEEWDLSDHNLIQAKFKYKANINWKKEERGEEVTYWKFSEENIQRYIVELEKRLEEEDVTNIERLNEIIRASADKTMKRTYTRKVTKKGEAEPPWMNNEIKEGIKERRKINRERRNEENPERRQVLWEMYLEQKSKVQELIKEQIREHERRVTEEIRRNKNKMWENIRKLKGENIQRESAMYNEQGQKLNEEERRKEMKQYWQNIYGKHENGIEEEWCDAEKDNYREEQNIRIELGYKWELPVEPQGSYDHTEAIPTREVLTVTRFPTEVRDHIDTALTLERSIKKMESVELNKEKVKKELKSIKKGKAAGPDGLKGELYIPMAENEKCLTTITKCLKEELEKTRKPQSWKTSKTVLLEKKARPTVKDYRPVALTDITYKLYMALLRNEIEAHVSQNGAMEEQAGFTKGARIEDNLTILKHLVDDARKNKNELVITGIDFTKAFDSVKRNKIIETLKKYKVDNRIINTVAEIYMNDVVELRIGKEIKEELIASSGIRQGCTLSATLFKLITYRIITELNRRMKGYKTNIVTIRALFFADDGLLISEDEEQAAKDIRIIQEVAEEYGLNINKEKSSILWINKKGNQTAIEGIEIRKDMKYLGILIEDTRDIFRRHKENKIRLAEKLANNTHSILTRSCNRLIIGKAYWKCVALPAIIYGGGVIQWNKKEQEKLQIIQNRVCRSMLNAPRFATNTGVRGEVGISTMETRLKQNRMGYTRNRLTEGNALISKVVEELVTKGSWKRDIDRYKNELEVEDWATLNRTELKRKTRNQDTSAWRREMENKKTLQIYRSRKEFIKEEEYYNEKKSEIWFQAKTNCLRLRDRAREDSKECRICAQGDENLMHFMLHCSELANIRSRRIELQKPHIENEEEVVGDYLFKKEDQPHKMGNLYNMWKRRMYLLRRMDQ